MKQLRMFIELWADDAPPSSPPTTRRIVIPANEREAQRNTLFMQIDPNPYAAVNVDQLREMVNDFNTRFPPEPDPAVDTPDGTTILGLPHRTNFGMGQYNPPATQIDPPTDTDEPVPEPDLTYYDGRELWPVTR